MISTSDYINQIAEKGEGPERGPYSFSRLGACPLKFKFDYMDRVKGTELTRFGQNIGSAMHDLAELDVIMRLHHDESEWLTPSDLVTSFLDGNEKYHDFVHILCHQLTEFRQKFEVNPQHYVASEQHVGATIDMKWTDYDADDCWYRGRIDYLEVDNAGLARVVDYKNYPGIHSNQSLNDIYNEVGCQLMGYVAMVMAMDPRIRGAVYEVYYFRYGISKSPYVNGEDGVRKERIITREEVQKWWRFNQRKMLVFERRKNFPAQPAQKTCQYCSHINQCDWYQGKSKDEIISVTNESAKDYARRMIVLDEEKKRLKSVLDVYTKAFGTLELEGGVSCGPVPQEVTSVDVEKFIEVCKMAGVDATAFLSVTKTNAYRLMKSLEDGTHKKALEDAITTTIRTVNRYG